MTSTTRRIGQYALAALVLAWSAAACTRIDTNEAAVYRGAFSGEYSEAYNGQKDGGGLHHAFFRDWTTYSLAQQQHPREERAERVKVLSKDNLPITVEAAYTWEINPDSVRYLRLNHGSMSRVDELTYKAFRASLRDAGAQFNAVEILSLGREALSERVREQMNNVLNPEGVRVPLFFVRDIDPPKRLSQAIQEKLAAEQEVEEERYRVQVEEQKAEQRRARAAGIRDEQNIIAESLLGQRGQRFLQWRYFEVVQRMADGENNTLVVPVSDRGTPLILNPNQ